MSNSGHSWAKFVEVDVPLEEIHINRIARRTKFEIFFLCCSLLIGFFFFATLISKLTVPETVAEWELIAGLGSGTCFSLGLFIVTKQDELILRTDNYFFLLYQKRPSKQEVDRFIDLLKDRVRTYVRNKYLILNRDLDDATRARHLFWLFEHGFVTQHEFETIKAGLREIA